MIGHFYSKMLEAWDALPVDKAVRPDELKDSMNILHAFNDIGSHWGLSPDALDLIWHTDVMNADLLGMRLPYQTMIVEYVFDYERLGFDTGRIGDDRQECRQRFFVLSEVGDDSFALLSGFKISNADLRWVVAPVCLIIKYTALSLSEWMTEAEVDGVSGFTVRFDNNFCSVKPSLPMYRTVFDEYSEDALRSCAMDVFDEFRVAVGLLAILNCSNAPVATIPAPDKLNKKRVARGKSRIPEYRTLHITSHVERSGHVCSGRHASPRVHWRRGHIRNQPTAKGVVKKWIRPTIIGAGNPVLPEVVLT